MVIYMPVSPLAAAAMLACARIGAIHRCGGGGVCCGGGGGGSGVGMCVGSRVCVVCGVCVHVCGSGCVGVVWWMVCVCMCVG